MQPDFKYDILFSSSKKEHSHDPSNHLSTHLSHLLLYLLADTLQESIHYSYSVNGKLPHYNCNNTDNSILSPYSLLVTMLEIPTYFLNLCRKHRHKTYFFDSLFQHTVPIPLSHPSRYYVGNSNIKPIFPTHFSNILFTKEKEVLSHLFPFIKLLTYSFQPPSAVPTHRYSAGSVPAYSFH